MPGYKYSLIPAELWGFVAQGCPFRVAHTAVQHCQRQMTEREEAFAAEMEGVKMELSERLDALTSQLEDNEESFHALLKAERLEVPPFT